MCTVIRASALTALWVIALALMTIWTAMGADIEHLAMPGWSVLSAMIGSVLAGWEMIAFERLRVEDVATRAAEAALAYRGLESLD